MPATQLGPPGPVTLVGAGPGSPDLITLRGLRAIRAADVLLYDALVAPELVNEASPAAVKVAVGKRGYCVGSTKQEHINDLLVRYALEGKSVCRLKGGDPCVFGRGGEEAEALAAAGVPFEFVPGVTAALGAAASARIPLTHRDAGQAVTLATGHHDPDSPECTLDWDALARTPTVVFYMASRHVAKIAARLVLAGRDPTTPLAVVSEATTPREQVLVSTLDAVAEVTPEGGFPGPALVVVGEVVRYRELFSQLAARRGRRAMIRLNTIAADAPATRRKLVIVGNGMAGARVAEDILAADPAHAFDIVMFGDEPYGNYNRILLSNVLNGSQDAKEIFLNPLAWYAENNVTLHAGARVTSRRSGRQDRHRRRA